MNVFSRNVLACGLSAVIALSGVPVVALADEADEAARESAAIGQGAAEASDSDDSTSAAQQGELKENSWRYQDGQLIPEDEDSASARSGSAWSLSEYGYLSSNGSVIPGALNKGIDVSEHQGRIDWEAVKADGIDFAIIRCGYGSNFQSQDDLWWEYNVSECERLGIPYGVYLYSYAYNTDMAWSEAQHALRLLEGHRPTLPVFFDMEDSTTLSYLPDGSVNTTLLGDMAYVFCEAMEDAGYWAGVYANLNWFTNYLTDSRFELYMRWVAQYNYRCDWDGPKVLWQSTSSGSVDGVNGNVDINFDYFGFCYPDDVGAYDWYVQDGYYFYATKFGYIKGYDDTGLWGPNDQLTRAQTAMILWRAAGKPWADAEDFYDVDYGQWYGACIEWARQSGIVTGYEDGSNTFHPDEAVTREQLAVMLARYARTYGHVGTWADDSKLWSKADAGSVSHWAWDDMAWAVNCGILEGSQGGDGRYYLNPLSGATRAEASKMITVLFRDVL